VSLQDLSQRVATRKQQDFFVLMTMSRYISSASQNLSNYPRALAMCGYIDSGAYEARRLVPAQNLGPEGTLWSVSPQYCREMLLDPEIAVLDAFSEIKNTKIDIGRGSAPNRTGGAYTALLYLIAGGKGASCPPAQEPHPRIRYP